MKKFLLFAILSVVYLFSFGQAGSLDSSFGTNGKLTTSIGTVSGIRAMAIQADGKIVVAGLSHTGSNKDFGVVRYNTNGTLDNSFDGDGKVITAIGAGNADDIALCAAIQADDKIIIAGYTFNASDEDFALVRYNSNGSLDNTFDGDGKLVTSFGAANNAVVYAIAIQPDGKIVVAGLVYSGTDNDFALARYNINGSLDSTFDGDGKVQTPIGASNDAAYSIVLQPDGKIVIAGVTFTIGNADFALARYNNNGSLDNTFDGDGKVITTIGSSSDVANSITLQADGKLVVAGQSDNGSDYDFALARYNTNGSLDNTFDGDGKLTSAIGLSGDIAYAVAMQADAKIITAGSTGSDFALARYNTDGSLDNSFDGDGKVITDINANDYGYAMKLSGFRIYMAGQSNDEVFAVAAFRNDTLPLEGLCNKPTGLKAVNITSSSAKIKWDIVPGAAKYKLQYRIQSTTTWTAKTITKTSYNITGLTGATTYEYRVQTYCTADGSSKSKYTGIKTFATSTEPLSISATQDTQSSLLKIYPDPANDFISINYSGKKEMVIVTIYDAIGKLVKQETQRNELSLKYDVKPLKPGIYFIQVSNGYTVEKGKFVRE